MRIIYLLLILFSISLPAQAQFPDLLPLESNPTLKRLQDQKKIATQQKLKRYFGDYPLEARTVGGDCDNETFENGQNAYVI